MHYRKLYFETKQCVYILNEKIYYKNIRCLFTLRTTSTPYCMHTALQIHTHTLTQTNSQTCTHTHTHTHRALNHLHSLVAQFLYDASNIHYSLILNLIHDTVNGDQCSSPTHTSTTANRTQQSTHAMYMQCFGLIAPYTCSAQALVLLMLCAVS